MLTDLESKHQKSHHFIMYLLFTWLLTYLLQNPFYIYPLSYVNMWFYPDQVSTLKSFHQEPHFSLEEFNLFSTAIYCEPLYK